MQSVIKPQSSTTPQTTTVDLAEKLHVESAKQKRTTGLKLLDTIIYPVMNNFGVFVISVFATYLTNNGSRFTGDDFASKTARWLEKRGDNFMNFAQNNGVVNLSHEAAKNAKMVFFSFLDGSLMAPFIKLLEDRREKIARAIDTVLGTLPEDESVYEAEPKQTWKSVLLGRAATALVVVPTAILLQNTRVSGEVKDDETGEWVKVPDANSDNKEAGKGISLNQKMFGNPGLKLGDWLNENAPGIQKKFPRVNIPDLSSVAVFEAFYTSVCTAGLYFSSRLIASRDDKKNAERAHKTTTNTHSDEIRTLREEIGSLKTQTQLLSHSAKAKSELQPEPIEKADAAHIQRVAPRVSEFGEQLKAEESQIPTAGITA